MSVHSTTFGAVRLSGKEASKLRNQLVYGKPKSAARAMHKRASELHVEMATKGYVTVRRK